MRDEENKKRSVLFIPHPSSLIPTLARPLPQAVLTHIIGCFLIHAEGNH